MTVTAHFFNNEYILESYVLSTTQLVTNHTAIYLSSTLRNIFEEWHITEKVVAIVTDGAANIKAAINLLGIYHLPCAAHMLNLVSQHAISNTKNFEEILLISRALVSYFKNSVVASDKLRSIQEQMGIPVLKLKKDVLTRWNSILNMLERLLKLKEAISAALASLPNSPTPLTADHWNAIEECITVLKPLEIMTTELSAEKYPTVSKIIPLVRGVQINLRNKKPQTTTGSDLQHNILKQINERLGKVELLDIPAAATLLDPRFKKCGFGNSTNAEQAHKNVHHQLSILLHQDTSNTSTEETPNIRSSSSSNAENIWEFLDERVSTYNSRVNPTSNATIMLRQYLEQPYEDRKKSPAEFWKKQQSAMEPLCTMAQKYLSIPATSVPSERVFSKAGQILSERRNRLKAKNLDFLIFLNSNLPR